ncbi:VapE family protein [Alteromonadaceae bacterium BrNp21-10]|nr:VapE family protein [Alteromonadaceae bacterium BrNp21-10]
MSFNKEKASAATEAQPTDSKQAQSNQQDQYKQNGSLSPDWLNETVLMAIEQEHRPIPFMGSKPAPFGSCERYPIDHQYWQQCDKSKICIALDRFILVDYDGNKEKGAINLEELFAILGDEPNEVQTNDAGDSLHFLYRIPDGVDPSTLKHSNDNWVHGVDIKTQNQLMYIKRHKQIIDGELPTINEVDDAPQAIIDALTIVTQENIASRKTSKASKLKAAELLSYVDPDCAYDPWLNIGMALHREFNGDQLGLEIWDNWSATGKNYCGFSLLRYKWNSFDTQKPNGVTFATICHIAEQAGANLREINSRYDENGEPLPSYEDLMEQANQMDKETPPKDIEQLAAKLTALNKIESGKIANVIKTNTGTNITDIRAIVKQEEKEQRRTVIESKRQPMTLQPMPIECFNDISFNEETGAAKPLATISNIESMLNYYGITTYYDVIKKKSFVNVPTVKGSPDNVDNTSLTACISLAKLNQLPSEQVPDYIFALADTKQRNPVADWITTVQWDGKDRITDLCNTLIPKPDYPILMRDILIKRWLISAVAAVLKPMGFKARGVLTLQGAQSIGKTSWLESLVPDLKLRKHVVKTDHLLDPADKDSVLGAVSHWLVELGELDSTFKKDVARLKGFITADMDKLRRPYARLESEYQRRTVFFASVNDTRFLVDDTGNTRFWTIPVEYINFKHTINMQQLWAQVVTLYQDNEQWWLTREEESKIEELNGGHRVMPAVRELILSKLDFDCTNIKLYRKMSATELLIELGYEKPNNSQCREAGSALRDLLGDPQKINGLSKWKVPPLIKSHFNFDDYKSSAP